MNLVFTLNFNNFMCENAMNSQKAAAIRWGCEYMIYTERYFPEHFSPSCNKLPYLADKRYKQILYIDADILVRSDSPNPFNLVPLNALGVVSDIQSHQPKSMRDCVQRTVHEEWFEKLGKYERPFNGGFIISAPALHSVLLSSLVETLEGRNVTEQSSGHFEQALLNLFFDSESKVYLGERWNTIFPNVEDPTMRSFCYHFTGYGFSKEKRKMIETYQWNIYEKA